MSRLQFGHHVAVPQPVHICLQAKDGGEPDEPLLCFAIMALSSACATSACRPRVVESLMSHFCALPSWRCPQPVLICLQAKGGGVPAHAAEDLRSGAQRRQAQPAAALRPLAALGDAQCERAPAAAAQPAPQLALPGDAGCELPGCAAGAESGVRSIASLQCPPPPYPSLHQPTLQSIPHACAARTAPLGTPVLSLVDELLCPVAITEVGRQGCSEPVLSTASNLRRCSKRVAAHLNTRMV